MSAVTLGGDIGSSHDADLADLIRKFAEPGVDAVSYVNGNVSAVTVAASLNDAQKVLRSLEAASERCMEKLDKVVEEMVRVAPRLGYDVELLRSDLASLRTVVEAAEPARVSLTGAEARAPLAKLAENDKIRERMLAAQRCLADARRWTPPSLAEDEVSTLIDLKDWPAAAAKVTHYDNTLKVWRNTPGHELRWQALEKAKRKLADARAKDIQAHKATTLAAAASAAAGTAGASATTAEAACRSSTDSKRSGDGTEDGSGYYSSLLRRTFIRS
ncbi:hypothetical protein PYCC9005_002017 [Savitreella phatthalungensis]